MLFKFVKISEISEISVFFEETNGLAKARPYFLRLIHLYDD